MTSGEGDSVIRRKIAASHADRVIGTPGADRGWRLALARAARDRLKLPLEVNALTMVQASLAEVLELPPERALIALVQGPGEGMGLLVVAPEVLAGMIEVQTLGRVASTPIAPRRPTRTDAAMVAEMLDAALVGLEVVLADEADLIWAGGFRYASFLDDPRPLGLLLEDVAYRVLQTDVTLGQGGRRGSILLALPADGKGNVPRRDSAMAEAEAQAGPAFAEALAAQIGAADCVLRAVLARVSLPLSRLLDLAVDEVLPLPRASIDRLSFVGLDGRILSDGKLGQQRGMRAIRLSDAEVAPKAGGLTTVQAAPVKAEPLRQAG